MFRPGMHPLYQGARRSDDDIEQKLRNYVQMTMELVVDIVKKNEGKDDKRKIAIFSAARVAKIAEDAADFQAKKIIEEAERRGRTAESDALQSLIASMLGIDLSSLGEAMAEDDRKKAEEQKDGIVPPWNKQSVLGKKGAFGTVYLGVDKVGKNFALKEIPRVQVKQDSLRDEICKLKSLSHENVVKYLGCGKSDNMVFLYMDLLQCSIRDKLDMQQKPLPAEGARKYTVGMLAGLNYLHYKDIVHHDIKCSNVLLNSDNTPKLSDIQLSKPERKHSESEIKIDSYLWMSPEILSGQPGGKRSDIWSLGCTVYEMLKFRPPFYQCMSLPPSVLPSVLGNKIANVEHRDLVKGDQEMDDSAQKFLLRTFVKMDVRPLAHEIVQHEWLKSA